MDTFIWNRRSKPNQTKKVQFMSRSYQLPELHGSYISKTKESKENQKSNGCINFHNIIYIIININYF